MNCSPSLRIAEDVSVQSENTTEALRQQLSVYLPSVKCEPSFLSAEQFWLQCVNQLSSMFASCEF